MLTMEVNLCQTNNIFAKRDFLETLCLQHQLCRLGQTDSSLIYYFAFMNGDLGGIIYRYIWENNMVDFFPTQPGTYWAVYTYNHTYHTYNGSFCLVEVGFGEGQNVHLKDF